MVTVRPAAVSEREGGRTLRPPSSTVPIRCGYVHKEPGEIGGSGTGIWSYTVGQTRTCVADINDPHLDENGQQPDGPVHRGDSTERTSRKGRNFTQGQADRSAWIQAEWERRDCPQPREEEIQYFYSIQKPSAYGGKKSRARAFEAWVKALVGGEYIPPRQPTDEGGPPIKAVLSLGELEEVVATYLAFDRFCFDVETHAGRKVRMLQAGRRVLSRYGEGTTPCLACGRPIPSRRRAYCSDLCRKAADKDKPALDARTNEVWCLSLAGPGVSHVIPMGHPDKRRQLSRTDVFQALKPLFFSDRHKINQNVGFDLLSIAKYYGELPPPPYDDIMTMVFLINENLQSYKLDALAKHYIGFTYAEKLGEEAYKVGWRRAMRYSIVDAKMAWMIWWKLHHVLEDKPKLGTLFDLEMQVLRVLLHMRQQGAYVDVAGFQALRPRLQTQLEEIGDDIYSMAGDCQCDPKEYKGTWRGRINTNSTHQLAHWFYDHKRLPCMVLTETNLRSTAAPAIKALSRRHVEPRRVLEYKDVNKLLSTYVVGFMPHIDEDSRIRASFNQAVARTGRLSCSAPNLQNIPARYKETVEATLIRKLFVAPPGRVLIVADYSQIELRILAHQTKDRLLVYAYTHGLDLHTQTASLIYKVPQDKVDPEQRAIAKNSNFNLAFEGGPGRIIEMSGISRGEAEKVYDAWHKAYPGVKKWGSQTKRFCLHNGYVETLYGRKRRLKDISSGDPKDRSYAERQAVNHPIQGTAADIAKVAIVRVHEALREFHAALVLQIHDEFVIECDEREATDAIPFIRTAMEDIHLGGRPVLDVPLEVNIGVGANWSEAK